MSGDPSGASSGAHVNPPELSPQKPSILPLITTHASTPPSFVPHSHSFRSPTSGIRKSLSAQSGSTTKEKTPSLPFITVLPPLPDDLLDFCEAVDQKKITPSHPGFFTYVKKTIEKTLFQLSGSITPDARSLLHSHCVKLTELLVKLSHHLEPSDPHYGFYHDNKTRMKILCDYAFGDSDSDDARENLRAYLAPYTYALEIQSRTEPGSVDLTQLVSLFSPRDLQFKLHLPTQFLCDNPSVIWGAIYNLCTNACKYGRTDSSSPAQVTLTFEAGRLMIANQGPPISALTIERLNHTFNFRFPDLTSLRHTDAASESSGKGLSALVHKGARMLCHGRNADGSGARISLEVPGYTPLIDTHPSPDISTPVILTPAHCIQVLIVDDEKANQKILARQVNRQEASGPYVLAHPVTLDSYDRTQPDLINFLAHPGPKLLIADQNISGKETGLDFVKSIQDKTPELAIVFATEDPIPAPYYAAPKSKITDAIQNALGELKLGIVIQKKMSSPCSDDASRTPVLSRSSSSFAFSPDIAASLSRISSNSSGLHS